MTAVVALYSVELPQGRVIDITEQVMPDRAAHRDTELILSDITVLNHLK